MPVTICGRFVPDEAGAAVYFHTFSGSGIYKYTRGSDAAKCRQHTRAIAE